MPLKKFPFLSSNFLIFSCYFPLESKSAESHKLYFPSTVILNAYFLHYFTPVIFLQVNILSYAIFSFMLNCFLHFRSSVHFFFSENLVFTDFYRTAIVLSRNF